MISSSKAISAPETGLPAVPAALIKNDASRSLIIKFVAVFILAFDYVLTHPQVEKISGFEILKLYANIAILRRMHNPT